MVISPIDNSNKDLIRQAHADLERILDADVFVYYGGLIDGGERTVRKIVEDLSKDPNKKDKLYVVLTTGGGSINPVKRIVNIFRNYYAEIHYIIPDYAYSAGTIMCCSGDSILMSYYSVLGPIDPQVKNSDGKFVAALGYLDKINDLITKAQNNTLTQAEFLILKDFDLAELRAYEQARDLAIDLLVDWLSIYKFKDWTVHADGTPVTIDQKRERAKAIATDLSDNKKWKSHGRPINRDELQSIGLKIDQIESIPNLYGSVMNYHDIMLDYINKYDIPHFIQTRLFV